MLLYFFFAFLKSEKEGTCLSAMQTAMQTATYYFSSSMPPVLILKALENNLKRTIFSETYRKENSKEKQMMIHVYASICH